MTGPPDRERAGESTTSDEFVERLADRIEPPAVLPPGQVVLPPGEPTETSDVHQLGALAHEDDALEIPPEAKSASTVDAFAEFEDEFEGETTRIDDSNLIAEESTSILEAAPAQPFLSVERGKDEGREFVLQEGENGVGRGIDNDVILSDVAVSRRHLKIVREGDRLTLRDLGSGNGTMLNGVKVSTAALSDGDRIELGETALVVRMPGADLGAEETLLPPEEATDEQHIGHSGFPAPPGFGTPSNPMSIPQGPGYQPEMTPSGTAAPSIPAAPRGAVVLPRAVFVAVIAGGALLLAMFGAAVAVVAIRTMQPDEEPTATTGSTSHYALGLRAYQANRWAEAEREFRAALEDPSPPEDQDSAEVQRYLERTALAVRDQPVLDRARELLANGSLAEASTEASSVRNADSPLYPTAQRLLTDIRRDQAAAAVADGRTALRQRDLVEARRQLDLAAGFDPESPAVGALRAELAAASGGAPAPSPPPVAAVQPPPPPVAPPTPPDAEDEEDEPRAPTPPRTDRSSGRRALPERVATAPRRDRTPAPSSAAGSGITRTVIQYYLAGDFERAANTASIAARTAPAAQQRELNQLAENIRAFARLWPQITRANFGPSVRQQMSQALALDGRIARNPRYAGQLRSHLVQLHLADAQRLRSNPVAQCRAVQTAYRIDSDHAEVARAVASCEAIARGMLSGAASQPPERRTALYEQIITMVPPSSAVGNDARRLRDAQRRTTAVDEDE